MDEIGNGTGKVLFSEVCVSPYVHGGWEGWGWGGWVFMMSLPVWLIGPMFLLGVGVLPLGRGGVCFRRGYGLSLGSAFKGKGSACVGRGSVFKGGGGLPVVGGDGLSTGEEGDLPSRRGGGGEAALCDSFLVCPSVMAFWLKVAFRYGLLVKSDLLI